MIVGWKMRLDGWRRLRASRQAERLGRYIDRRLGLVPTRVCLQQARATYIGEGVLLCRVQGLFYLYVPSRDINITPALANFGRVDPWISRVIARTVSPGMTVADAGANLGYFTMLLARQVGSRGKVHAFEPNVDLARLVRRSAMVNHLGNRIVVHPVPLGSEDGREMWLCVPGDALAGSAIHDEEWSRAWTADTEAGFHDERGARKEPRAVVLQRLDSLPDARDIAFAKIDVEGFEPQVWGGLSGLLAGDALRTIVIEYAAGHYADAEAFRGELYRPGWSVSLIDSSDGPVPISRDALAMLDPGRAYDLLLTR